MKLSKDTEDIDCIGGHQQTVASEGSFKVSSQMALFLNKKHFRINHRNLTIMFLLYAKTNK